MKRILSTILCGLITAALMAVAYASPSPLTGDNGIVLWIILMIVAVIVLAGVLILLLRKNRDHKDK